MGVVYYVFVIAETYLAVSSSFVDDCVPVDQAQSLGNLPRLAGPLNFCMSKCPLWSCVVFGLMSIFPQAYLQGAASGAFKAVATVTKLRYSKQAPAAALSKKFETVDRFGTHYFSRKGQLSLSLV